MGAAASLAQIPEDLLVEEAQQPYNQQILTSEVLSNIRRHSYSTFAHSKLFRQQVTKYEIPTHVTQFLQKIGIGSSDSAVDVKGASRGNDDKTTKLVGHIFECLGALQHMVRANQADVHNTEDESQSTRDGNTKSIGKLVHEMVTIYGLCGDTLKVLLDANPEAATVEDNFGRLALHIAVDRNKPWIAAVENLAESYPEALMLRDGGGRLPLHIAVDRPEPSVDVVRLLVKSNPASAAARRGVGRLPVHYAVFCEKPSMEALKCLIEAYPEGAQTADVYGRLPLHYAVDKLKPSFAIARYLLRVYPEGASTKDTHMRLPLAIAVDRERVNMKLIIELYEAYPAAIRVEASNGRLPIHIAVDHAEASADCVRYLAKQDPSSILIPTRPGRSDSALHMATARNRSEVIRSLLLALPAHDPPTLKELNWTSRRVAFQLTRMAPTIISQFHRSSFASTKPHGRSSGRVLQHPTVLALTSTTSASFSASVDADSDCDESDAGMTTGRPEELVNFFSRLYRVNVDSWRLVIMFL